MYVHIITFLVFVLLHFHIHFIGGKMLMLYIPHVTGSSLLVVLTKALTLSCVFDLHFLYSIYTNELYRQS